MDFWKSFDIQINFVSEITSDTEKPECVDKFHDMSTSDRKILCDVITQFPSFVKNGLGRTNILCHDIDVGGHLPIKQRHYPVSPAVQKEMYDEIDRMIELDVIEESQSAWCSPMAIVRKKNGKARLCLDARRLNQVTKKDAYPLPLIEGLLSRLDATQHISALDLKDAFWQIPLSEASKEFTAFAIPGRPLYNFKVMPFGLCNAPQTLCRLMHRVIPYQLHDKVFVYLDDLLITTASFEEHIYILKVVASLLRKANLTINVEKSKFNMKEVEYLGYVVGGGALRVNSAKVEAITQYPRPKTMKQVRRFLGMCGWYRRFIANYSTLSSPLTDLLKKSSKLNWSDAAENAFNSLKAALVSAPVLKNPDFSKRFYVQCDASLVGVGGVLYQKDDGENDKPIAFFSQKLNGAQKNYMITELECLAVVLSIKKFRPYIEKQPFTVITDHASLQWLMSQKDLSGRLARWSLKLQSYDFQIEHCSGSQNKVPDALSRVYQIEALKHVDKDTSDEVEISLNLDLDSPHFKHPDYVSWITKIKNTKDEQVNIVVRDDKIYINVFGDDECDTDISHWKLVVPKPMTQPLIKQAHLPPSSAHLGIAKTLDILRRLYFWHGMAKDVTEFIRSCEICKQCKAVNYSTRPLMGSQIEVFRPFQKLYIDFLGPYPRSKEGNNHILIVLDQFSRYVIIKAVKKATASVVIDSLKNIFHTYGVPESLLSDNGSQFDAHLVIGFLNKFGVNHIYTPKHSPHPNASERANRTLLAGIRSYLKSCHQNWDLHIVEICSALNNSRHQSTQFSPHYLVFGQHHVSHASQYQLLRNFENIGSNMLRVKGKNDRLSLAQEEVIKHLRAAYLSHASKYNLRARPRKFLVGQKVYVRNFVLSNASANFAAKLAPKFIPGIIVRSVGSVAYEIKNPEGKLMGIYHAKDIKS